MEFNIKKDISQSQINQFLLKTEPYFNCLSKLQFLKPKKYLLNIETGETTDLQSEDTVLEKAIKNEIELIKQSIFNQTSND